MRGMTCVATASNWSRYCARLAWRKRRFTIVAPASRKRSNRASRRSRSPVSVGSSRSSRGSTRSKGCRRSRQAALARAYEKIHQYRWEAGFEAWLWQIVQSVWKNAVRDRQATKRLLLAEARELTSSLKETSSQSLLLSGEPADPEQAALAAERTRVLQAAIDGLPPGMRRCTELRVFGDLKDREISDVTGIGLNSVRSQLFEARKRLKSVLEEYFQGAEL